MPALTLTSKLVNFSYSYDTLTVYPNFNLDPSLYIDKVIDACGKMECVLLVAPPSKYAPAMDECINKIPITRFVHAEDDEHALYHHDSFKDDDEHWHLKFKSQITRHQLGQILDIFVQHALLSESKKKDFLAEFDNRYQLINNKVDEIFKNTAVQFSLYSVYKAHLNLIQFIKKIEDNDVLTHLHHYLLDDKFDFLRRNKNRTSSNWQGTDAEGKKINTCKTWAMIERTLVLQMAHNIATGCQFTPFLASSRTKQFLKNHRFFGLKHDTTNSGRLSPSVVAFQNCDAITLDHLYQSHFASL